jgi:hypothetical protein
MDERSCDLSADPEAANKGGGGGGGADIDGGGGGGGGGPGGGGGGPADEFFVEVTGVCCGALVVVIDVGDEREELGGKLSNCCAELRFGMDDDADGLVGAKIVF